MNDDLTITSGGIIAVDSSMLRDIGRRVQTLGGLLDTAREALLRAAHALDRAPGLERRTGGLGVSAGIARLSSVHAAVGDIARAAATTADTFELVELRTEQDALRAADPRAADALQARIDRLVRGDPSIEARAAILRLGWVAGRAHALEDQRLDRLGPWAAVLLSALFPVSPFPALRAATTTLLGSRPVGRTLRLLGLAAAGADRGVLPYGTRLQGTPPPVTVTMVGRSTTSPAAGLGDSLRRIPQGREGQVIVEKYTMDDGQRRFVVYVDGTRAALPGTDEPWDMGSNWDLYVDRERSASHQATVTALTAAGARPGDVVDVVAYSQGGAIASALAMDGTYVTTTVITAGSPTQPTLSAAQTLVELRHPGDPVSELSAGGALGGTGSPGSMTVSRAVDGLSPLGPHELARYVETAGRADASGDPRMRLLHEGFYAELGRARRVEVLEFRAVRP